MSRAAALGFLVVLSVAAPAAAGGLSRADADAAATAFRLAYGSDVDIQLDPNGRGARFLAGFRTEPLAGDPTEAAWRFLEREAAILGLTDARATLRVEGTYEWRGWTAVRFRQVAYGRPVLGRGFVVLTDDRGRVYQVAGSLVDVSTIAVGELLSPADADAALRRIVPTAKVTMLEPVIFADGSTVRFAYRAEVENGGPFERFEVMQDAISGMPLAARSMFQRAQANVYEINPLATPTLTEVTLGGLLSTSGLSGDRADAYACGGRYCDSVSRRAVPDAAGDYFYTPVEPSLTDPFAEVQAYYEANKLNHYLEDNWTSTATAAATRSSARAPRSTSPMTRTSSSTSSATACSARSPPCAAGASTRWAPTSPAADWARAPPTTPRSPSTTTRTSASTWPPTRRRPPARSACARRTTPRPARATSSARSTTTARSGSAPCGRFASPSAPPRPTP
jgi:hypothetical protein